MTGRQPPSRTAVEQETVLGFNEDQATGWVSTTSPWMRKRLTRRLGPPRTLSPGSWTWDVPRERLRGWLVGGQRGGRVLPASREKVLTA
jgi:hypothetical protein